MLLKWLELENIRSYARERIEFQLGTTLLSGDVGSGKSTILLAVEFALFGIQRGELSGADLLRHGASEGRVMLCFEAGGKDTTISRTLKRDRKGISQEAGWIQIDGVRYSKTASELRAVVLELLGYPPEYQTKNPIFFRYTVYTPQDEMKRILFSDQEERLGILRKIFKIDKYGRIRANADIAIREMRALKREADSLSADFEQKAAEASARREQLDALGRDFGQQKAAADSLRRELDARTSELERISGRIRELNRLAQAVATKESIVKERSSRNIRIAAELSDLEKKVAALESAIGVRPIAPEVTEEGIAAIKRELENRRSVLISKCSLMDSEIGRYKAILERGRCEFCGQDVADSRAFKGKVREREDESAKAKSELARISEEAACVESRQREVLEYSHRLRLYENTERELREKQARLRGLVDEKTRNESERSAAASELIGLRAELGQLSDLEALERNAKVEFSRLQLRKNEADRTLARIESQIDSTTRELGRLEKEIAEKQSMRTRAAKLNASVSWLEQTFVPLMQAMEQTVMATVQREFNGVFQSWFGILMGSESLSVEVDDQFSPVIMQEGYQTEYQNLSGGEKTAVALAYRLALNKAINTLIENIMTKDLIVLDEPTDGFSSEQINRIRDVLNELNLRQMILVSHEPKIDAFVEHVIRFHKEGHVSKVLKD